MSKIVVLGANSFSGQDFVDLLLNNPAHEVIGISRSPERSDCFLRYKLRPDLSRYRYFQIDLNSGISKLIELLDHEKPDAIVNFAAQSEVAPSWEHPQHWFETNTVALAKLVNHLRQQTYLKRYVHISSPEAYGSCVGTVTEATPDNPSTPYAASKAAADMLLEVYRKQYGFPVLTLRATNVYGAGQQLFKIIPRTVIYLKLGKVIELHGGGKAIKSYIHIRDVSEATLAVLNAGQIGERYHISPDYGVAVREVVHTLCDIMQEDFNKCTKVVDERPGQDAAYVIDSSKIRQAFSWEPKVTLKQGLSEVVDWVKQYWPEISKAELVYQHKP